MARKLASVQKILDIQPIEGADKIEVATILGWKVVISKEENFKVGDLVVYIETDSKLPEIPLFSFMEKRKYIVKIAKFKNQVSQGLVLSLKDIQDNFNVDTSKFKEGKNLTEIIGIEKYDPELLEENELLEKAHNSKLHKFFMKYKWYRKIYNKFRPKNTGFPSWVHKTDEFRIQTEPELFEKYKSLNCLFTSTEKLDGQSATYFIEKTKIFGIINKYEFGVCSRNLRLKTPRKSSYWTIAKELDIENVLKSMLKTYSGLKDRIKGSEANRIVLQGEIIGKKIQANKYKKDNYEFYAFNLIIDGKKTDTLTMEQLLKPFRIKTVPILDNLVELKPSIEEMVEDSRGISTLNDVEREGKVWRNTDNNISFKVINPDFLLKYDK